MIAVLETSIRLQQGGSAHGGWLERVSTGSRRSLWVAPGSKRPWTSKSGAFVQVTMLMFLVTCDTQSWGFWIVECKPLTVSDSRW